MDGIMEQVEGIFSGMAIGVPAGQKLYAVMPGDTVRVKATVQFRGPAYSNTFHAAIGNFITFFDEIWAAEIAVSFAQCYDWTPFELTVDIPITKVANFPWTPGWFDIYAKIGGLIPVISTPRLDNMIEVILAPEFQNMAIASYDRIAGA